METDATGKIITTFKAKRNGNIDNFTLRIYVCSQRGNGQL